MVLEWTAIHSDQLAAGWERAMNHSTLHRCHEAPSKTRAIAFFQAGVSVRDRQVNPVQTPVLERAEEQGPEHFVFGVVDI
jgi:hypothetical protein